jgi:hypothetical protein
VASFRQRPGARLGKRDVLGVFGACMGSVSGQRRYVAATRMELAGLAVAAISALVPG